MPAEPHAERPPPGDPDARAAPPRGPPPPAFDRDAATDDPPRDRSDRAAPRFAVSYLDAPAPARAADPSLPAPPADDDALAMDLMAARLFGAASAPARVGRFTVIDRLGEGGMGVVYAAYDELLDRKVALKLLHAAGLAGGGDERLLREAQAMARLSHPNIVSVFEVGSFGDRLFIAMEFVRGQSLDAWLRAAPRTWQEVLPLLLAAGRGLEAAHRAGLVHRDYKPHNTLVGADGGVKVADFGLARQAVAPDEPVPADAPPVRGDRSGAPVPGDSPPPAVAGGAASAARRLLATPLTRVGAVVGTPAYMAPEQHAGAPCDARSDQFSYCVTVYQALYGSLPFPTTSLAALLAAVTAGRTLPPPPGSTVPPWLRRAVLRGLAADPAERWPSMAALLDALAADPAVARRRRVRLGLFGAGLGLLGLSGGWLAAGLGAAACPDGAAALAGAWDDARQGELAAAMHATGLPFAAATWAHLDAALGRYAADWTAMHRETCEAHRAGRQSDTQYDLRMRCLDQRRTSLAALTDVLAHPDPATLERAALAANALPPVAPCGDLEALLADPLRPPEDPARAPVVARVQQGLARARALESTGMFARAVATADELAADVAASEHLPFAAELALIRGRALLGDRPEDADAALTAAFRDGLRSGHDRVAAEALARRVFVRGYRFARPADAEHDAELVAPLLDRVGDDGRLRGEYLNNLGAVALGQGDWPRAESLFSQALAAKTAAFGATSGELVYTLANLGTLRNDHDRTGAAIEALQAAHELGAATFGAAHPTVLLVRGNLGMARLKHGRWRAAEADLRAVEAGAAARPEPDRVALAFVAQQLAWLALERRRPAAAEDHLRAAEAFLQATGGDPLQTANIANLRADVAVLAGDEATARAQHARARVALAALAPDHPRRRELDLNLAEIETGFGRPAEALALATAAAEALAAAGPPLLHAQALERRAAALRALGRHPEAIAAATSALAALERAIAEDNPRVAAALAVLAAAEAAAGRDAEALAHLARADEIVARCGDPDLPARALLRFERARLLAASRPAEARELATDALAALRAAGDGFATEAAAVASWLASRAP